MASASDVASRCDSAVCAAALASNGTAEIGATSAAVTRVGSTGARDDVGLAIATAGTSAMAVGAGLRGAVAAGVLVMGTFCSSSDEYLS